MECSTVLLVSPEVESSFCFAMLDLRGKPPLYEMESRHSFFQIKQTMQRVIFQINQSQNWFICLMVQFLSVN